MNKTMKKIVNGILFAFMSVSLVSCTSEDEASDGMYRYTSTELSKIQELQEEYGIKNINIPTESSRPLYSVEDLQELFALVSEMQKVCNNKVTVGDNYIVFSNKTSEIGHSTRASLSVETYSGKQEEKRSNDYGEFSYTVSWYGVDLKGQGRVEVSDVIASSYSGWMLTYDGLNYSFSGAYGLNYTVKFKAYKGSESLVPIEFSSYVNLMAGC